MQVTCNSCNKVLSIPDEKIPKGQVFSFNCPACKNKITVNADGAAPVVPMDDTARTAPLGESFSGSSDAPGAMVCHTEPAVFKALLEKLGYRVHTPTHHIEAVNNLRFNDYRMVLVTDSFVNKPAEQANILEHLQNMNMAQRRRIFLAYVADKARSFDPMEAFAKSVNMIVTKEDAAKENFGDALVRGVRDADRFYKIYFEVMESLGKA